MVNFGGFLKTYSLQSYSVTGQVNHNRTKLGGKCQNSENSDETFSVSFKQCELDWVSHIWAGFSQVLEARIICGLDNKISSCSYLIWRQRHHVELCKEDIFLGRPVVKRGDDAWSRGWKLKFMPMHPSSTMFEIRSKCLIYLIFSGFINCTLFKKY